MMYQILNKFSGSFANTQKIICNGRALHSSAKCNVKSFKPSSGEVFYLDPSCKVALVTGASGVGVAIARQLLQHGARGVVLMGLNPAKGKRAVSLLNEGFGRGKAVFVHSNVNCVEQFEETFKRAKKEYDNIDIVVNSAGILDGQKWEREVVTNLIGTIRGTLLGYKYMSKAENKQNIGGVIINVSGVTGLEPLHGAPTLAAEHHAIVGLSRSFGHDCNLQKTGVRVVCLCPGYTKTGFLNKLKENARCPYLGDTAEKSIIDSRPQTPEVIGYAVVHLVRHAKSGSVWVIESSQLYQTDIPPRASYMKLAARYR